jgi:hypothetical protein
MADPWQVLGIAPTRDQAEIRRAYAERLKATRPDIDPAGFRALRDAFEAARAGAPRGAMPPPPPPASAPPTISAAAEIRARLQAGRAREAVGLWHTAVAASELSFDEQDRLQVDIAKAVLADTALDAPTLDALTEAMQWEQVGAEFRAPESIVDVLRRRAALRWIEGMRAAGRQRWVFRRVRRRRRKAARLLLRPAPGPIGRRFPYVLSEPDFAFWLDELPIHRRFLPAAPDPARIAWCQASRTRWDAVLLRTYWRINLFSLFAPTTFIIMVIRGIFSS